MAFFEQLGKKISKSGQDAAQKAKNLAETVRINGLISEDEKRINSTYFQIGKLYYETFGNSPSDERFAGFINEINDAKAMIQKNSDIVKQLRGVVVCEKCGGEVSNNSTFCSACGTPITVAVTASAGNACTNCASLLTEGQVFCTNCGTKSEPNPVTQEPAPAIQEPTPQCANCGQLVESDAAFCLNCGTKIN